MILALRDLGNFVDKINYLNEVLEGKFFFNLLVVINKCPALDILKILTGFPLIKRRNTTLTGNTMLLG